MKNILLASLITAGALVTAGCTLPAGPGGSGAPLADAALSTRVKARFAEDADVNAMGVQVTASQGTVQLAGFAATEAEKARAGQLARGVPDVKDVRNHIVVGAAAR
ncbi:BON domain-containing protein [Roseateles sp. BYS96W]|uniref:BON domain-containing protein n=1 Tax=Pelomonas nitida TaxID=3299027 RepID=A0ABW7G0V0_9BURK